MTKYRLMTGLGIIALAASGLSVALPAASAAPAHHQTGQHQTGQHQTGQHQTGQLQRFCSAKIGPGQATCNAIRYVSAAMKGKPLDGPPASALTPAGLQDAYNLTGLKSKGATVAIVDAYGYPNLERDLGIFRDYFGLPACTTANGCLTIMDQNGGSNLPPFNGGWAGEQALDVDAVSSACPDCKIVVVQSKASNIASLSHAERTAAAQPGVVAISNSFSGHDAKDQLWGKFWHHPGIAVTASTGDSGFSGAGYPASSQWVTAVGGTSLTKATNDRGWNEAAWAGAGSGCSRYNVKPLGQQGEHTTCLGLRGESDVSAAADPGRGGLAWYGPANETTSGWGQVGGTSESSPIIAAVYALSGNTDGDANNIPYGHSGDLFDIVDGQNGSCGTAICTAGKGWDGPTGLGTPNGAGAF